MNPTLLLDVASPLLIGAVLLVPLLGIALLGVGVYFVVRAILKRRPKTPPENKNDME